MPDLRLLLAEDHQMTRVGLRLILEGFPEFTVCADAKTGQEALTLCASHQPDFILMDIGMPEMDGIQATQEIKQRWPVIKILMLTSKDSQTDVLAALASGADGYCMKGVEPETLRQAIHTVAEGNIWLDGAIARIVMSQFQPGPASAGLVTGRMNSVTASASPPCPLTEREMEVLGLIVEGFSNPGIAGKLYITNATAKAHVHSILQKLCVDDRTQAAVLAMRNGYV